MHFSSRKAILEYKYSKLLAGIHVVRWPTRVLTFELVYLDVMWEGAERSDIKRRGKEWSSSIKVSVQAKITCSYAACFLKVIILRNDNAKRRREDPVSRV